jgi:hAT family C-terminal dimerisation region
LGNAGIEKEDLYIPVNDTATAAVAVGKYLTDTKGTCAFHRANLIMEHATGHRTRKSGGEIIDSFPECENIRKKAYDCASYLNNKRKKKIYRDLEIWCKGKRCGCRRILLPNSTRAGGMTLMYSSLVSMKFVLRNYWHKTPSEPARKAVELEEEDFEIIAELESVLFPLYVLILNVQTDTPGSMCYAYMHVFPCLVQYLIQPAWMVANVSKKTNGDEENWWLGNAKYPDRKMNGKVKPGFNITGNKVIALIRKPKNELGPVAQKLIQRIAVAFKEYGGLPTDHQLLAMMVNPLSLFVGFPLLSLHQEALSQNGVNDPDLHRNFLVEAHELLQKALDERCTAMLSREYQPAEPLAGLNSPRNAVQLEDPDDLVAMALLAYRRRRGASPTKTGQDVLKAELTNYCKFQQEWHKVLRLGGVHEDVIKKVGTNVDDWIANWTTIAEHFSPMKWWEDNKTRFPHIYIIACQIICAPASNGYQERTFSAATWMDGKLSTRQTDATFQMKVLLYKNQDFIRDSKFRATEEHKKLAREKSLKALNESIAQRKLELEEAKKLAAAKKQENDSETSSDEENVEVQTGTVSVVPEEDSDDAYENDDMESLMMDVLGDLS